jgi:hypothetical protein
MLAGIASVPRTANRQTAKRRPLGSRRGPVILAAGPADLCLEAAFLPGGSRQRNDAA